MDARCFPHSRRDHKKQCTQRGSRTRRSTVPIRDVLRRVYVTVACSPESWASWRTSVARDLSHVSRPRQDSRHKVVTGKLGASHGTIRSIRAAHNFPLPVMFWYTLCLSFSLPLSILSPSISAGGYRATPSHRQRCDHLVPKILLGFCDFSVFSWRQAQDQFLWSLLCYTRHHRRRRPRLVIGAESSWARVCMCVCVPRERAHGRVCGSVRVCHLLICAYLQIDQEPRALRSRAMLARAPGDCPSTRCTTCTLRIFHTLTRDVC